MTIHWKAVEQYFTVVLFVNPLTPRVKPWLIQSAALIRFWTWHSERVINLKTPIKVSQYKDNYNYNKFYV